MWPYILGIVFIIACLLAYLFKAGVLGKAKVKLGATPFVLELDMQSNKRQISEKEFNLVNLSESYADSGIGFVILKPLSEEWALEKVTLRELYKEKGFTEEIQEKLLKRGGLFIENPEENVNSLMIRRGEAQSIQYTEGTIIDGGKINFEAIKSFTLRAEEMAYDRIAISAFKKEALKIRMSLLDFFFTESQTLVGLGPKRLHVNPENTVFLLDCSALFEKVVYNGELGDHVINNAMLFQENDRYFFEVTISYVQSDDKSTKVWDELRDYLASFRVLVK